MRWKPKETFYISVYKLCFKTNSISLCEGFIFKTSRILLQHIYYFLHGYQSSLWQNQPFPGDRSVQNFYFSTLISSGPAVFCAFCSPALFFFLLQSFLSINSKHDSGIWERRRVHCVQCCLYVNVYILILHERDGGCARLSSSSGRLKNVRRGQQNSKVDPR